MLETASLGVKKRLDYGNRIILVAWKIPGIIGAIIPDIHKKWDVNTYDIKATKTT